MKIARWLIAALAGFLVLLSLYTWKLSQPVFKEKLSEQSFFDEIKLAPIDQALTFSRLLSGEVLLVMAAGSSGIEGLELIAASGESFVDGADAYRQLGSSQLRTMAVENKQQARSYTWEQLGIPVNAGYPHIGAGTNYRAHAEEVGHEGDPFVFPKFSRVTAWNASVKDGTRLDYEVELCAVLLTDHTPQSPADIGYILCGDYTDRWTLVKEMDIGGAMGPTGFAAGKGGETRFPVGSLLLIPEGEDFYNKIELKLYLNGRLRQRSRAGLMIWPPHQVLNKALSNCQVPYFRGGRQTVVTPSCHRVAAGTLLLTGTPEGVLFNIATLWSPFAYMGIGDEVLSSGTYLGFMRNRIVGSEE